MNVTTPNITTSIRTVSTTSPALWGEASTALDNLSLTEALELSFLDKLLKREPAPLLDLNAKTPPGVKVEHIGK
jgi:hypothetical protein